MEKGTRNRITKKLHILSGALTKKGRRENKEEKKAEDRREQGRGGGRGNGKGMDHFRSLPPSLHLPNTAGESQRIPRRT